MNRTRDKGKKSFCGESSVGQGLLERAGFKMKKGYRQEGLPLLVKTKRITERFPNDDSTWWSSTENDTSNAWNVNFNNGTANSNTKSNNNKVRPVLAFT